MQSVNVINFTKNNSKTIHAICCNNFICKLKGLMFKDHIKSDEGIIFVNNKDSIIDSSIHMFFMKFYISIFWVSKDFIIVDKKFAKRWHPLYYPKYKAKYTIETHICNYDNFSIGDKLAFE